MTVDRNATKIILVPRIGADKISKKRVKTVNKKCLINDKNDRSRKSEDVERKCYINDKNGRRKQNLVIILDDKMQFLVQNMKTIW